MHSDQSNQSSAPFIQIISVTEALAVIKHYKYHLLISIIAGALIGAVYTYFQPKTIMSTATIKINSDKSSGGSMYNNTSNLSNFMGTFSANLGSSNADAEKIKITTSPILNPFIRRYLLNITITPHRLPLIGNWIANRHTTLQRPWFGKHSQYDWGGAQLTLSAFTYPSELINSTLRLQALEDHQFALFNHNQLLLHGTVGQPAFTKQQPKLSITVSHLIANPGTNFDLHIEDTIDTRENIAESLAIINAPIPGEDTSKSSMLEAPETGYLQVKLTLPTTQNPQRLLETLLSNASQQSIKMQKTKNQEKIKQIQSLLNNSLRTFSQGKLKVDEYNISDSNNHSSLITTPWSNGAIFSDPALSAKEKEDQIEQSIETLKTNKTSALAYYTLDHPLIHSIDTQLATLKRLKKSAHNNLLTMDKNTELTKLNNDININEYSLQSELTAIEQLLTSPHDSDFDIIDPASKPVSAKPHLLLISSTIGGILCLIVGLFSLLSYYLFTRRLTNPAETADALRLPLLATLPFVNNNSISNSSTTATPSLDALFDLCLTLQNQAHTITSVMASSYHQGCTHTLYHLAHLLAAQQQRVLLIDADLRQHKLTTAFKHNHAPGLAEYLSQGDIDPGTITIQPYLDLLPAGRCQIAPPMLLNNPKFKTLLEDLQPNYDSILLASPPILGTNDAILIAQHSTQQWLLAGMGTITLDDVNLALKRLRTRHIEPCGLIANYTSKKAAELSFEYRHHHPMTP